MDVTSLMLGLIVGACVGVIAIALAMFAGAMRDE